MLSTTQQKASATPSTINGQKPKKQLILNAFVCNSPGHLAPGLWKHPKNRSTEYNDIKFWQDLAQMLEKENFHSLFIADILGVYDSYKGPGNHGPAVEAAVIFPVSDPMYIVPAMAAVTKNLTFGVTASTTYEKPYALARKFSTLDHLTKGRIAWNIVTSYLESAAKNFGLDSQVPHDERYKMADEYMDVVYKLWESSWRDDAVVKNTQTGQYGIADRVRRIDHKGQFFNVPGPHICEPSRQRTPFLFQAGTSKSGRDFGAKHAEAVFLEGQNPEKVRPSIDIMRQLAVEKYGRDPSHIKFIAAINIFVAETDEEAEEKRKAILSYGDKDGALALFGGWTGIDMSVYSDNEDFRFVKMPAINSMIDHWAETVPGAGDLKWNKATIAEYLNLGGIAVKAVGSPKTVVDIMEEWVEVAGVDGFNLYNMILPGSYEDIIKWVLPELRSRGLFRDAVSESGLTARETFLGEGEGWLLPDHPGRQFRWVPEPEMNGKGKRSRSKIETTTTTATNLKKKK